MSEGKGGVTGTVRGIPMKHVTGLLGPESPWFLSPSGPCGHPTLLLSAHLLLSLCAVSGHLIAISSHDHLSRKEGFNIWTQEYRIRSAARCSERKEPKTIKVTQEGGDMRMYLCI